MKCVPLRLYFLENCSGRLSQKTKEKELTSSGQFQEMRRHAGAGIRVATRRLTVKTQRNCQAIPASVHSIHLSLHFLGQDRYARTNLLSTEKWMRKDVNAVTGRYFRVSVRAWCACTGPVTSYFFSVFVSWASRRMRANASRNTVQDWPYNECCVAVTFGQSLRDHSLIQASLKDISCPGPCIRMPFHGDLWVSPGLKEMSFFFLPSFNYWPSIIIYYILFWEIVCWA